MIPILSYSQTLYPKKIVLNKDTVVVITPKQLKLSNQKMLMTGYYRRVSDTLMKEKAKYLKSITIYQVIIDEQSNLNSIADAQIRALINQLEIDKQICDEEKQIQKKKNRRRIGIALLIGLGLGLLI